MRTRNPQAVIARFERGNFSHDEECWHHYIAALAKTGQAEFILPRIMQKLEQSAEASASKLAGAEADRKILPKEVLQQLVASGRNGAASAEGISIGAGAGTKNSPVYVIVEQGKIEEALLRVMLIPIQVANTCSFVPYDGSASR